MADDQHILLPFQLHDDGFQSLHQVLVGLWGGGGVVSVCCPPQNAALIWGEGVYLAFGITVTILVLVP